jgi:hypothetical protein
VLQYSSNPGIFQKKEVGMLIQRIAYSALLVSCCISLDVAARDEALHRRKDGSRVLLALIQDMLANPDLQSSEATLACLEKLASNPKKVPLRELEAMLPDIYQYVHAERQRVAMEEKQFGVLLMDILPDMLKVLAQMDESLKALSVGQSSEAKVVAHSQAILQQNAASEPQTTQDLLVVIHDKVTTSLSANYMISQQVARFLGQLASIIFTLQNIESRINALQNVVGTKDEQSSQLNSVQEIDDARLSVIAWLKTISRQCAELQDKEWCSFNDCWSSCYDNCWS